MTPTVGQIWREITPSGRPVAPLKRVLSINTRRYPAPSRVRLEAVASGHVTEHDLDRFASGKVGSFELVRDA